jgi:hypothetical protein
MRLRPPKMSVQSPLDSVRNTSSDAAAGNGGSGASRSDHHPVYRALWHTVSVLLILSVLLLLYSISWEISTRRYLRGFSDAIVPATAPADEKVEAILNWMAHGPARLKNSPNTFDHDRDPTDTLNYEALLQVCGTATNAFINLVDSGGLSVRRLLLVNEKHLTKHVTAEVLVDGRWIVADPAYRLVFRGPDGSTLTREQLADPVVFAAATKNIHSYDPAYTFDHTLHIRMARLRIIGPPLRVALDYLVPGWEDSTTMTLLVERKSFAFLAMSISLLAILLMVRLVLRWYGEKHLQVRTARIRDQVRRAAHAFMDAG